MLPDIDAMRTMLPWILFATMSLATAFAVMNDPNISVSKNSRLSDDLEIKHTDRVDFQHALKVRYRIVQSRNLLLNASTCNCTLKRGIEAPAS